MFARSQVLVVTKNQILRATEIIQTRLVQGLVVIKREQMKLEGAIVVVVVVIFVGVVVC